MSIRLACLVAVVGCHQPAAPRPTVGHVAPVEAALPRVSEEIATVTAPVDAPPVLVLVTAETTLEKTSRVRLATVGSWSAIATLAPEQTAQIDTLEVSTLLRAASVLGWTPSETIDQIGKPVDFDTVQDAREHEVDPDDPPPPGAYGGTMTLDGPPDARPTQLAASGGIGVLGMFMRPGASGWDKRAVGGLPMRMAEVAGEVVETRRLAAKTPAVIVAPPQTPARTLIWVIGETEGALAVTHGGHVTALRTQFVHRRSDGAGVPWIELRVPANGTYELEAVADTPVTLHSPTELATALATLRAAHKLDPWNPIDLLVGPDLTAQDLVDLIVALDRAGAHAIGLGPMPEGNDLASRGHPIRDFTLRQVVLDGDVDRHPVQVALNELPLQGCYESALLAHPELEGRIDVAFSIAADGTVSGVTATGVDDGVDACMAKTIATLHVPAHGRGQAKAIFLVAPHVRLF